MKVSHSVPNCRTYLLLAESILPRSKEPAWERQFWAKRTLRAVLYIAKRSKTKVVSSSLLWHCNVLKANGFDMFLARICAQPVVARKAPNRIGTSMCGICPACVLMVTLKAG